MTRLEERTYKFWRNFSWICAAGAVICVLGSIISIALGSRSGWVALVCCVPLVAMSVAYFRLSRRLRQAQLGRDDHDVGDTGA